MDYKEIKRLMDDMGESKLSEIEIEFPDGIKIKIKKDNGEPKMPPIPMHDTRMSMVPLEYGMPYVNNGSGVPMAQVNIPTNSSNISVDQTQGNQSSNGNVVKAPMVGTFYSKSSPTAEPFVKVGSKVKKGDTLCIIEAMKLMNEIESEYDGEVIEILVKDEEMVDYGKPLYVIK